MKKLTYREAYDKIIDAYFKNEIQPMNMHFCFCGTLSPEKGWKDADSHRKREYPYSYEEYTTMERALFSGMTENWDNPQFIKMMQYSQTSHPDYEEQLFKGMSKALDELKKIHIERGENIEETPAFIKRQLKEEVV